MVADKRWNRPTLVHPAALAVPRSVQGYGIAFPTLEDTSEPSNAEVYAMGYDCTLHLIDEKAIREEFVPRLLGKSRKKTALDRVVDNADELWSSVRTALDGNDADEAASLICQLAIKFSACSLPHQFERGFALSLWEGLDDETAVKYPHKFAFSPEPLFADVVKEYPKLHGHFPTWFTSNYSTGVFIPSKEVSAVLA
jgi:hypothetical protein